MPVHPSIRASMMMRREVGLDVLRTPYHSRSVKILHVFKDYFPPTHGGIEHLVHDLAHGLSDRMQTVVLTSSRSRRLVHDWDGEVEVIRAPEWFRISTAPVAPSWIGLLREIPADVIHFHMPNPTGELAYLAARSKRPCVATYHADVVRLGAGLPLYAALARRFMSHMNRIVLSSPPMLESVRALRTLRDRCVSIAGGIDVEAWAKRPPRADEIRNEVGGPIVLFLGRLRHYKGVEVLVEAMQKVDATLLVGGEGPEHAHIARAVERFGVGGRVRMLGPLPNDERAAYYHAADVFVLPSISRGEAYGIVLLEAMACGTPVISTELGTGTSWVNRNGETGLVVPPRDPVGIAEAVNEILGDDAMRATMSDNARRRVRDSFTLGKMLDAHASLYESVAAQA
jgi:rhamnosyl/mannosyltransferase